MKDEEFQKLLNAAPPVFLEAHKGKLFICVFFEALGYLIPTDIIRVLTQANSITKLFQRMRPKNYYMILIEEGFGIRGRFKFNNRWDSVEEFKVAKNGIIYFNFKNKSHAPKMGRIIKGSDFSFYNIYAIKTPQLTQLLNHWRERALANK